MAGRVIGDAYVRIRALSDKLEDDIQKALDGSDASSKALGDKISKGLRESVKEGLKDVDKTVKESLSNVDTDFTVNVDTEVSRESLEDSLRKIDEEVNRRLSDINYDIKINVDDKELITASDKVRESIPETVDVKVNPKFDKVQQEYAEFLRKFGIEAPPLDLKPAILAAAKKHVKDEIQDLIKDLEDDEIELHPSVSDPWYRRVQMRLATLTRPRTVSIKPEVDNAALAKAATAIAALSGARLLGETVNNITDAFKNLDKSIPKLTLVTQAVGGLSAFILTAVSNLSSLATGLVQALGAGLALPGIMAGMAVGLGASIAVFKDFGAYIPGLSDQFGTLQNMMSRDFWRTFQAPMQQMIDVLFPEFSSGMMNVTSSLGGYFSSLASSVTKHLSGSMTPMFGNLAASIDISRGHTDSLAQIIEVLGRKGSEYLPRLATWAGEIADKFANWLKVADDSGTLDRWIQTGIQRLGELRRVLTSTGEILWEIMDAANQAGGSQIAVLADTLERVAAIVGKEPFKSNLVLVFTAAHDAMASIARVSGPAVSKMFDGLAGTIAEALRLIGPTLGELAKGIAKALDTSGFDAGLSSLLNGMREAVVSLTPMWGPLGEAIGAVGTVIGALASNFAPLFAELLTNIAELAIRLSPTIISIVEGLSGALLPALDALLPVLVNIIDFLLAMVEPILTSVPGLILLAAAFVAVGTAMGVLKFAPMVDGLLLAVQSFKNLRDSAANAATGLTSSFGKMGKALGALAIVGLISGIGHAVVNATRDASPAIDDFTVRIGNAAEGLETLETSSAQFRIEASKIGPALDAAFKFDTGNGLAGYSVEIQNMAHSAKIATTDLNPFTQGIYSLNVALGLSSDYMGDAKGQWETFDEAVASMVRQGNIEAARVAVEEGTAALLSQGASADEVAKIFDNYDLAMEEHAISEQRLADAAKLSAVEILNYANAIQTAGGVTPEMIASINEASKSFVSFNSGLKKTVEGVGEVDASVDEWLITMEKQVVDQNNWATNMTLLAGKVSKGTLDELTKLGPEGGPMVANLVNASEEELARLEEVFRAKSEGAITAADTEFSKLADMVTQQMAGINLKTIDPSGKLEETFRQLGYNVTSDGFVDGMVEGNPAAGAAGVLSNINLASIDPSGKLEATFKELGYNVQNGFITGFSGAGGGGTSSPFTQKLDQALRGMTPTVVSAEYMAMLQSYGATIPEHITVGVGAVGDIGLDKAIYDTIDGTALTGVPTDFAERLRQQGHDMTQFIPEGVPSTIVELEGRLQSSIQQSLPKEISAGMASALQALGVELPDNITIGAGKDDGKLSNELATFLSNTVIPTPTAEQIAALNAAGLDFVNGFVVGIDGAAGNVGTSGEDLANKALNAVKAHLGIESPSKKMKELGEFSVQGFVEGLGSTDGVGTAGNTLAQALLNAFTTTGPSLVSTGASLVGSLIAGVTSQTGAGSTAGSTVGSAVTAGVKSVSALSEGTQLGASAVKGVNSKLGEALTAGTSVATNAKTGLGSQNATDPGSNIGKSFAAGLATTAKVAEIGSVAIAIMTRAGLGSVDAAPSGVAIGTSFARGLAGVASTVAVISASVARSAVSSLDDYAPSAASSGASIGNSFARGLRDSVAGVRAAAQAVAAAARAQLPNSPAKEGPFSGSGWGGWGESIAEELADGMVAGRGSVRSASENMLGAIGLLNPSMASNSLYTSASSASSLPSALDSSSTGIIGSGSTGATTIIVNADIKDLAGVADLAEFIEMTSVWSKQGYSPS